MERTNPGHELPPVLAIILHGLNPPKSMRYKRLLIVIVSSILLLSAIATCIGIFSDDGPGSYEITSIRGKKVMIYGIGAYKDMSAEVAPQGIAQDIVTLCVGTPLLLLGLLLSVRNSIWGRLLLTGTLGYYLVTYLFFVLMAMYNQLFLLWVLLLSLSFYGFILSLASLNKEELRSAFNPKLPVKLIGGFLMLNALTISLLWLSIVVPAYLEKQIPRETEHYTTLVVQAMDLAILLPGAFIAGIFIYTKRTIGYLAAPVYIIFLILLMTALTAKVIAMGYLGYNILPAIFIIPTITLISLLLTYSVYANIKATTTTRSYL